MNFLMQLGKMLQNELSGQADVEITYLKALHVNWGRVTTEDLPKMWASLSELENYEVQNGDLLVCEGGEVGRAAIIKGLDEPAIIQNALHRLRGTSRGEVRYFAYLLRNIADAGWFAILCNKATIAHLTGEKLGAIYMPVPTLAEQQQIAAFLDWKTGQIDALTAKKKELLEKLKEKRLTVITQAVTKGLNPAAPLRDSGIPWLGKVPAHWSLNYKLGFLAASDKNSFVNGPFGSDLLTTELVDEGVPVLYSGDIKATRFYRKSAKYVTDEKALELNFCRVDTGDVLLAKVGDPPGDACVYPMDSAPAVVTQDVVRIRVDRDVVDSEFLSYLLVSVMGRYLVRLISVEATRGRFSLADLKSIRFPIPPPAEQQEIAKHLSTVLARIDKMGEATELAVASLNEYRTALITAATTGKIDVRKVAVPSLA